MDGVHLASRVLHKEKHCVPDVVKDMPEVIHCIQNVVLGVVPILIGDYVEEMCIYMFASSIAVECNRMELLGDLGNEEARVKEIVDVLIDVLRLNHHTSQVHYLFCVCHQIILDQALADQSLL